MHSTYVGPSPIPTKTHCPRLLEDEELLFVHPVPLEPAACDMQFQVSVFAQSFSVSRVDKWSGWDAHVVFNYRTRKLRRQACSSAPWDSIPSMLLSLTLGFLSPYEVFRRARIVCRRWNQIKPMWTRLVLPAGQAVNVLDACHVQQLSQVVARDQAGLECCLTRATAVTDLRVEGRITNRTLGALTHARGRGLQSLTLCETPDFSLQLWLDPELKFRSIRALSTLTKLHLDGVAVEFDQLPFVLQAPLLQDLQLHLISETAVDDLSAFGALRFLRRLDLSSNYGLSPAAIASLVQGCPGLEDLVLRPFLDATEDTLFNLSRLTDLRSGRFSFFGPYVTHNGLQHLSNLTKLERVKLSFYETSITSRGFEFLAKLPSLQSLELDWDAMTTEHLSLFTQPPELTLGNVRRMKPKTESTSWHWAQLARLERLTSTYVASWHMTDRALLGMIPHLSRLRCLHVPKSHITDKSIRAVCKLQALEDLKLTICAITDQSLRLLAGMPSLTSLGLHFCSALSDQGFMWLSESSSLARLELSGLGITDDALEALSWTVCLRHLEVDACEHITDKGLKSLVLFDRLRVHGCARAANMNRQRSV